MPSLGVGGAKRMRLSDKRKSSLDETMLRQRASSAIHRMLRLEIEHASAPSIGASFERKIRNAITF